MSGGRFVLIRVMVEEEEEEEETEVVTCLKRKTPHARTQKQARVTCLHRNPTHSHTHPIAGSCSQALDDFCLALLLCCNVALVCYETFVEQEVLQRGAQVCL
jgi:hypothetical protein